MKRIARTLTAAALASTVYTPAAALSCMPSNGASLYVQARDSEDSYVIVRGRLADAPDIEVPKVSQQNPMAEGPSATTRVRMTGVMLRGDDFTSGFDTRIDVTVTCLSVWCGDIEPGPEILAALRVTDDVPELLIDPCGGLTVPATPLNEELLLQCHRNDHCDLSAR